MIRRLHRVNDTTQPGRTPSLRPPRRCQLRAVCTAGRPPWTAGCPLPPADLHPDAGPRAGRSSSLAVPAERALSKASSSSPACLCAVSRGVPRGGSLHRTPGFPARLPTSPGGVPRCWGDPATLPQGTPSSEGRGAAVAQHPLVCRAAGPPAPGSADSRSLAKTSVCQCPSLQPTDNFTGVWKALLKLTPHGAVSPGPTLANWAPKASRLPHTGSPGCDRPPLTHGWHAFSAHLYAATITHRRKNCQIIQWLFN